MQQLNKWHSKFGLSLQTAVTVSIVLLLVATVGVVGYFLFRAGQQTVETLAAQLQQELIIRVIDELDNFLDKPHTLNQLNALAVKQHHLDFADFDSLRQTFFLHLLAFPSVTTCATGTKDGEFLGVGCRPDNSFDTAVLDRSVDDEYRHYLMDDQGNPTELLTTVANYDARTRPWYKAAVETGRATWSPVYVWASQSNIGISAVLPVYDKSHTLTNVQLSALSLKHISEFLQGLKIGSSGETFIMERSGLLIATSATEKLFRKSPDGEGTERVLAVESRTPMIQAASNYLWQQFEDLNQVSGNQQFTFFFDGQRHYLRVATYTDTRGLDWLIAVVVPEADFMQPIYAARQNAFYLALIAVISAILLGIGIVRWVVSPIRKLNTSAKALTQGKWGHPIAIERNDEIGELTQSFNMMVGQLQESFNLLEQRVIERTAALETINTQLKQEFAERRQIELTLKENRRQLSTLLSNLPGIAYRCKNDQNWTMAFISDGCLELTGYPPTDLIQNRKLSYGQVIHPDDRQDVWGKVNTAVQKKQKFQITYRIITTTSAEKWVWERGICVFASNGSLLFLEGFISDVSESKRAEEALQQYNERLEEIVKARTWELEKTQEQLVRREKLAVLGQLAGSVAHELRNPLGVLSNAVYFLNLVLPDANETVKEYLDMISAEIRKSDKIVTDLLGFSRTRLTESKERVNVGVSTLIQQVLSQQQPLDRIEVSTQISPDLPPVFVDPQQITQVLTNLVTNVYQAMPYGGRLFIEAKEKEGSVTLSIKDTGTGIAPENIDKLFEPLFTTKAKGIGLGLAVTKNLLEANHGTIEVESKVEVGSTFTIKLPIKER